MQGTFKIVALLVATVLAACNTLSDAPAASEEIAGAQQSSVVARWSFDDRTTQASTGEGTASAGPGLGGESFPQGNPISGLAWSFTNWGQGERADPTRYVEFTVSTEGADGITFSFDERRSNTGPSSLELRYSVDGETFGELQGTVTALPNNTNFRTQRFDLSSVTAFNNQTRVALRIYGYGASGAAGTWRFDNVTVSSDQGGSEPPPAGVCGEPFTPVYDLTTGVTVTEGVLTADFRGPQGLNGLFIQDAEGDDDPATSDGIFVFLPAAATAFNEAALELGDLLHISGTVREQFGCRQLDFVSDLDICDSDVDVVVTPTKLTFPVAEVGDLMDVVGMLVTLPQTMTVTGNFNQGRFGELILSASGRQFQPNQQQGGSFDPETFARLRSENDRNRIILDDGSGVQNPNPIPYLVGEGEERTLRAGSTVTDTTGVLMFDFGAYRIHPTVTPAFSPDTSRTDAPEAVGGDVTVASYNVLNYFTTFGNRGARNATEFERQSTKLVEAIRAIDADVVGLIEIENNGSGADSAVQDLVNKLNAAYGSEVYAVVPDPVFTGGDAIKQDLIYKPARLSLLGEAQSDPDPAYRRPPIAQTFRTNGGEVFTVVVNHFKSKSCGSNPPATEGDFGQGCFNAERTRQSEALVAFIDSLEASTGDGDILLLGDYNAYSDEDPVRTLREGGFEDLTQRIPFEQRYSYVFGGEFGTLDYAFASESLAASVTGVTVWKINADEPRALGYDNLRFSQDDTYSATPYYSSDHEPVVVGLALAGELIPEAAIRALITDVQALIADGTLRRPDGNRLVRTLEQALRAVERGRGRDPGVRELERFVRDAERLSRGPRASLSREQADSLTEQANAIIAALR